MADLDLRERVRQRYAAAAVAVTGTGPDGEALAAEACCGSSAAEPSGCCSAGACAPETVEVGAGFGAARMARTSRVSCQQRHWWPAWAAGIQPRWPSCASVSGYWTWAPVVGSNVSLSARRVGESGFAYGVDMTDEMLSLARNNARKAGVTNVEFRKGTIEQVPLPDGAVDVVISNCVINLSVDKPAVLAEMYRVLTPGGRVGGDRRGR